MDSVDHARINGDLVAMTYRSLKSGIGGVQSAKECLRLLIEPIIENGQKTYRWQNFRIHDSSGVMIEDATDHPPKTFREFVESRPFRGLGEKMEDIERLLADDKLATVRIEELKKGKEGAPIGNQNAKTTDNNIISCSDMFEESESEKKRNTTQGTSRAYTLTRLHNERPDLFELVVEGEMSANAAAIMAGWRKQATALETAQRAWKKMTGDEQQEFLRWISNDA
jgi:hypothetical protein